MTGLFLFVHTVTCILLVVVILMQSGRGGGLTEGFAGAESMFGAKTNELMIKTTTILACVFLVTSLVLARLSADRNRSLMPSQPVAGSAMPSVPVTQAPASAPQAAKPQAAKAAPAQPAAHP